MTAWSNDGPFIFLALSGALTRNPAHTLKEAWLACDCPHRTLIVG
jgi:hypothetical protein